MRTIKGLAVFVLMFAAGAAGAGEIFGKVYYKGAAVGEGAVTVELRCGETTYPPAKSDAKGGFRLVAQENGKCTITVRKGDASGTLDVGSYDQPVQVDLSLDDQDGKLSVRRK